MSILRKQYLDTFLKQLQEKFNYSNKMLVPKVTKIIINMGLGDAAKDKNVINDCINELALIAGQKTCNY